MSTDIKLNNASLDACGNRMELRSNRIKLKKNPFREAILFRRSRIKRPKEALLIIISNSRPRRASFFAALCDLCESLFQILFILCIHVQNPSPLPIPNS